MNQGIKFNVVKLSKLSGKCKNMKLYYCAIIQWPQKSSFNHGVEPPFRCNAITHICKQMLHVYIFHILPSKSTWVNPKEVQ